MHQHSLLSNQSYFQGGTIGLFTGLSIISIVEASFWLFRTLVTATVRGKVKEETNEEGTDDCALPDVKDETGNIVTNEDGTELCDL